MKFYSEKTKSLYTSTEELEIAEKAYDQEVEEKQNKQKEKKSRADEVMLAYKKIKEAEKDYYELKNKFVKDYGSYHMSYYNTDDSPFIGFDSIFSLIFK